MTNSDSNHLSPGHGEFIFYQSRDGQTRIECRFEEETIKVLEDLSRGKDK